MATTTQANSLYQQLSDIQSKLSVPKNHRNNFGGYNYRNAEDIIDAVKPLLNGLILTISDEIVQFHSTNPSQVLKTLDSKNNEVYEIVDGDRFYVKATASIRDGKDTISVTAYARESQNKKGMDDSQVTGSTSSYARKYALNGLFAIDDGVDADSQKPEDTKPTVTQGKIEYDPAKMTGMVTPKQISMISALMNEKGRTDKELYAKYNVTSKKDLTKGQASQIIDNLSKLPSLEDVAKEYDEPEINIEDIPI